MLAKENYNYETPQKASKRNQRRSNPTRDDDKFNWLRRGVTPNASQSSGRFINSKEEVENLLITLDPQVAQYLETLKALTPSEKEVVTQALKRVTSFEIVDSDAHALAETITGKSFSRQERIQLEMESLAKHFQHRRQLLDSVLSAAQVAQLLGISHQILHDRVNSQTLLAIKENGKLCFPSWQFDPAGPDGVIDGLPDVLRALEISDYTKLNWLTHVNPYLDSQTPIQALKARQKERVLAEASTVGAGQWS